MQISIYLAIGAILAAAVIVYLLARYMSTHAAPPVVQTIQADAWTVMAKAAAVEADSTHDLQVIAAAQASIATRQQRLAAFQAQVAALGQMAQSPAPAPAPAAA